MAGPADFVLRFALFAACHSLFAVPKLKLRLAAPLGREGGNYRLAYNLFSLALFAWVMAAWPEPPVLYFVPGTLFLLCRLGQGVVLFLLWRCVARTGVAEFLGVGRGKPAPPVTDGCYGRVRHPLYSLSLLLLALNPVMTGKWLLLILLAACYFAVGAVVEERRLGAEFGPVYREYRRRTPMFLPRLRP